MTTIQIIFTAFLGILFFGGIYWLLLWGVENIKAMEKEDNKNNEGNKNDK